METRLLIAYALLALLAVAFAIGLYYAVGRTWIRRMGRRRRARRARDRFTGQPPAA